MAVSRVPMPRIALFLGLVALFAALDLGTKSWIFGQLDFPPKHPITFVPGVFELTTNLNQGALFGIGQGKTLLFAVLSVVAIFSIAYWFFLAGAGNDRWLTIALASITAGILGNLYDRLGLPGLFWPNDPMNFGERAGQSAYAVRDWLHFQIQSLHFDWPVFNLADSMLVVGAAMLFWHVAWREPHSHAANSAIESASLAAK